jgi:hypothetical protein
VNVLGLDGDRRVVRFLNDVRHLTDPQLFGAGRGRFRAAPPRLPETA